MNTNEVIEQYTSSYKQLKKKMKWKVFDNRIIMTIAATYIMNHHTLNYNRFSSIANAIKKEAGFFSSLKSELRFTIAAILDIHFEEPEEQVSELIDIYNMFIKAKFKRGSFTYLAASVLLTNTNNDTNRLEVIHITKTIYKSMQKEHPFLTTARDYPLAIFLALRGDRSYEHTEDFYIQLNKNGLRKGNELQLLSHILSIDSNKEVSELVSQTTFIYDSFKTIGIKQKTMYYPLMGMLALLPNEKLDMDTVHHIYEQLNQQKQFKWQKDLNLMLAVSFFIREHMKDKNIAEINLFTTLEAILQVQQAIIVSSSVAATTTTSSNSGN